MNDPCLGPEDLDSLLEGGGTPELQAHLERCRACRLLVEEYRCFLAAEPVAGADSGAAHDRLSGILPPIKASRPAAAGPGLLARLFGGSHRLPILAGAALAVIALVVLLPRGSRQPGSPTGVMRGAGAPETDFRINRPVPLTDGGWRLDWTAVTGADTYQVVILDQELRQVGQASAGAALSLELAPDRLPSAPSGPLFVRVLALAKDRELERTPLRELARRP